MKSIRRFLVIVLVASIAVVNFVAAWYGYRNSMNKAEQLFDNRLADIAEVLAETPPGYYRTATGDSAIAFQLWKEGMLKASSANVPSELIAPFKAGYTDINIRGFRWRAFARQLPESGRWVLVAESADIRATLADSIVLDSVLPIILGLPVYGLLIWIVVGRGLRPLDQLAGEMRIKRSDDLSEVAGIDPPEELSVLITSINDLLRRLNASFERERQFAADAAHELRTPISVLKLQLHNLLRDANKNSAPLTSLQKSVERMERSVEQVLMLYRLAPDQFAAQFETVDVASLARQTIAELYPQLQERNQQIELIGDSAQVTGDAFALQILLRNLIENASRYSEDKGNIRVSIESGSAETILTVEDSGPGIPKELRERVFERFYRGQHDAASDGSGIGLAIVQNIAAIHGAKIKLGESDFASGLAVSVLFSKETELKSV